MADFIIVGAGLSGIAMAEEFLAAGYSIRVYDKNSQSASRVAGGVMNPVILKRFTLAWNADEQLQTAKEFYRDLEKKLSVSFFSELPVYRKFHSVEEQNNWFLAADKPSLGAFLDTKLLNSLNPFIPSQFKFGKVQETAVIDTERLLIEYKKYLQKIDSFSDEIFDYDAVAIDEDHCSYKSESCKGIIFCEGMGLINNPFFNYLPLRGNKGEYIIVRAEELKLSVMIKSSIFIIPLGNDLYKVGATYNNHDRSLQPTLEAREYLDRELSRIISCEYEIVDQVAGIRPASADRRPFVGAHPVHKNLYCCNGFGSRGVLAAPTVAKQLLDNIQYKAVLPSDVDIIRFKKRFLRASYNEERN